MVRPWFSFKFLCVGFVCLSTTSCLKLDVQIKLTTASSGTLDALIVVSPLGEGLEPRLSASQTLSFPRDEAGWTSLVQKVPGITLTSFQTADSVEGRSLHVIVSFLNPQALTDFFALFGETVTFRTDSQNLSELIFVWKTPNLATAQEKIKTLWNTYWGQNPWVLSIQTPRRLISQSEGARPASNQAVWTVMESALTNDPPPFLRLTW